MRDLSFAAAIFSSAINRVGCEICANCFGKSRMSRVEIKMTLKLRLPPAYCSKMDVSEACRMYLSVGFVRTATFLG